jgi:hypothetical protein
MSKPGWTEKLTPELMDRVTLTALTAVGGMLEGRVIGRTPYDTRRLVGSITYATKEKRSGVRSPAKSDDGVSVPPDGYTLHVGTNVEYAAHVEYGTKYMDPQSYLVDTLKEDSADAIKLYRETLRKALA